MSSPRRVTVPRYELVIAARYHDLPASANPLCARNDLRHCLASMATVERLLEDLRRNKGLVVSGGSTIFVRPHGSTQAFDEFRRPVASLAKQLRQPVAAK